MLQLFCISQDQVLLKHDNFFLLGCLLVNLKSEWFDNEVIYDNFWIHHLRLQNQSDDIFVSMAFVAMANCGFFSYRHERNTASKGCH